MDETVRLAGEPSEVSPDWLTEVLRRDGEIDTATRVIGLTHEPIGTGQVGNNVRFTLRYDGRPGPPAVVCKFGSSDPASAAAGVQLGLYETEVAFYRQLAATVDVARPRCFYAAVEPGTSRSVIVMEDLSSATPGDQIAGCGAAEAASAVEEAARLHGPRWGDPGLSGLAWLHRNAGGGLGAAVPLVWGSFVERYGSRLAPVTLEAGRALASLGPAVDGGAPRYPTPVHFDFRLDNMLFGPPGEGRRLTVVDWQTVQIGTGAQDVAYFMGSALDPGVRRSCERDLVARYHRALVDQYAVDDYPLDECWADYVRFSYSSLVMAVFVSMVVGRTDRGDAMFLAMANRSSQMAADLEAPTAISAA